MASNSFGTLFRITTWGESHGAALGVTIDGVPAGLSLTVNEINTALALRAPGKHRLTSPRREPDQAQILSGVFNDQTTGAPISIIIYNQDANPAQYDQLKESYRPGHANYTYLHKYGVYDHCGGGRASARETVARVAAAVVANKLLSLYGIQIYGYLKSVGTYEAHIPNDLAVIQQQCQLNDLRCPDQNCYQQILNALENVKAKGDSLGGIIECQAHHCPIGLGEPIYDKVEMKLAAAMMSIPATKGFEIGEGFHASRMLGSQHNDHYHREQNQTVLSSNHSGGTLAGLTNGQPVVFRVAFKPTSSIRISQPTVNTDGEEIKIQLPADARHDPCVALRAIPIVEAMCALVLADCILLNTNAKIPL